jgi:hypothetical protein
VLEDGTVHPNNQISRFRRAVLPSDDVAQYFLSGYPADMVEVDTSEIPLDFPYLFLDNVCSLPLA